MSDIQTSTVSEDGFASTSQVGDFELTIDALGEEGPDPNSGLVADYASCFLPAFRVGGQQRGHDDLGKVQIDADADLDDDDDLGKVQIDADADLDDDDDLEAIRFDIYVEADLDEEALTDILGRAEDICHVHSALREELRADATVHGDAF